MPKNKRDKYERVKDLPNVTFFVPGASLPPASYPWYQKRYAGMAMVLELGCGKGEHSLAFASGNPRQLCVGIDYKSHRMCVGAEKALALGLDNVHFLRARVEHISDFFVPHSVHELWLTFPDPHLKNRNVKSRLSAATFLDAYANLLVPGGKVFLKTDSDLLYNFTLKSVQQWGGQVVAASNDIHGDKLGSVDTCKVVSAYEIAALSRGIPIKYMAFTLT